MEEVDTVEVVCLFWTAGMYVLYILRTSSVHTYIHICRRRTEYGVLRTQYDYAYAVALAQSSV